MAQNADERLIAGEGLLVSYLKNGDRDIPGVHGKENYEYLLEASAIEYKRSQTSGELSNPIEIAIRGAILGRDDEALTQRAARIIGMIGSDKIEYMISKFESYGEPETRISILRACSCFGPRFTIKRFFIAGGQLRTVVNGGYRNDKVENFVCAIAEAKSIDNGMKREALQALQYFKSDKVISAVEKCCKEERLRDGCLEIASVFWEQSKVLRSFVRNVAKDDKTTKTRRLVSQVVSNAEGEDAVSLLIDLVGDSDFETWKFADARLSQISGKMSSADTPESRQRFWEEEFRKNKEVFLRKVDAGKPPTKRGIY